MIEHILLGVFILTTAYLLLANFGLAKEIEGYKKALGELSARVEEFFNQINEKKDETKSGNGSVG